MTTTARRWAAGGAALLGLSGLVAGCQGGPPLEDYVHRVFDLQCARIFACCDATGRESFGFGATEISCRADRARFEQLAVNSIQADLDLDLTRLDEGRLASCLVTLEASSCHDYFARRDRNCEAAFSPRVDAGGDCSSNLACRSGLCVGFVCTGDTRALGVACSRDDECLSSSCQSSKCAESPALAVCSGAATGT